MTKKLFIIVVLVLSGPAGYALGPVVWPIPEVVQVLPARATLIELPKRRKIQEPNFETLA